MLSRVREAHASLSPAEPGAPLPVDFRSDAGMPPSDGLASAPLGALAAALTCSILAASSFAALPLTAAAGAHCSCAGTAGSHCKLAAWGAAECAAALPSLEVRCRSQFSCKRLPHSVAASGKGSQSVALRSRTLQTEQHRCDSYCVIGVSIRCLSLERSDPG